MPTKDKISQKIQAILQLLEPSHIFCYKDLKIL